MNAEQKKTKSNAAAPRKRGNVLDILIVLLLVAAIVRQVCCTHCAVYILAYVQRTFGRVFCPPFNECLVVGSCVSYFPIYLRYAIVYPSFVYPMKYIGIKVVIALQAFCVATVGRACSVAVAVYSKR